MIKTSATILILILLALVVRIYHIDAAGLSKDETLTLCRVNGVSASLDNQLQIGTTIPHDFDHQTIRHLRTYDNVVEATIEDSGNAIAYNILLSYWTRLFGNTNTSMRMMSLVFGILTVVLGYYFCRQLFNVRTAIIAGLLLCLHPILVEYGQLARSYVPATLLIMLATYSIYQVSVAKKHTWLHIPLYVILLNLSLLCHYMTLYIFISHIFLVAIFHSHKKALIQYAIMSIVGFGIFSIWLFNGGYEGKKPMSIERSMWQQNISINGEEPTQIHDFGEAAYNLGVNWMRIFGNDLQPETDGSLMLLLMILIPAFITLFVFRKVRKSEYFRPVMFVTFPLIMYGLFIIIMILRTRHSIPFDIRYATFVMPFACLLLAFGFDRMMALQTKWILPGYALIGLVSAIMIFSIFPGLIGLKEQPTQGDVFTYHHAADFIESHTSTPDIISFQNSKDAILTNFYLDQRNTTPQHVDSLQVYDIVIIRNGGAKENYTLSKNRY